MIRNKDKSNKFNYTFKPYSINLNLNTQNKSQINMTDLSKHKCCLQIGDASYIIPISVCKLFSYLLKSIIDYENNERSKILDQERNTDKKANEYKYKINLKNDIFMQDLKIAIDIVLLWSTKLNIDEELKRLDISSLYRVMEVLSYLVAPEEVQDLVIYDFIKRTSNEKLLSELVI